MSVRGIHDRFRNKSCMYCSTTGLAFGPVFDRDDVFDFIDWMSESSDRPDPRDLNANTLDVWLQTWQKDREEVERADA